MQNLMFFFYTKMSLNRLLRTFRSSELLSPRLRDPS